PRAVATSRDDGGVDAFARATRRPATAGDTRFSQPAKSLRTHAGDARRCGITAGCCGQWTGFGVEFADRMRMRSGASVLIRRIITFGCVLAWLLAATAIAGAQEIVLQCDAAQTAADFNLGDSLHTVKGSF